MSRGQPDYGVQAPFGVMGGMSDLGEVAGRLASICTYDRRGNVFYLDDFEGLVMKFGRGNTAPGLLPVFDSVYCLSGSQAVWLNATATGISVLTTSTGVLGSQRLGMELAIGHKGLGGMHEFEFHYLAQTIQRRGVLRISPNATIATRVDLDILDSAGAWIRVGTQLYWPTVVLGFGHIKLVCDFETGFYARLLYDAVEYDISDTALAASVEALSERVLVRVRSTGGGGVKVAMLYADDLILTCQEP